MSANRLNSFNNIQKVCVSIQLIFILQSSSNKALELTLTISKCALNGNEWRRPNVVTYSFYSWYIFYLVHLMFFDSCSFIFIEFVTISNEANFEVVWVTSCDRMQHFHFKYNYTVVYRLDEQKSTICCTQHTHSHASN